MIQYFMKQYLFLLWGITSLIFSSLFLACSDDEPGDKTPVFTIKEEYLQQDYFSHLFFFVPGLQR